MSEKWINRFEMKCQHVIVAASLCLAATFAGCQNREGLAKNVTGTWQSSPEIVVANDSADVSLIKSYEFVPEKDAEGALVVSAMLSIEKYMPGNGVAPRPFTVSAVALASVTGTYEAVSYDKIILHPEASTFAFSVDSAAVRCHAAGMAVDSLAGFRQQIAEALQADFLQAVKSSFTRNDTLTQVAMSDTMISCHIGADEKTLRLQSPR